MRIPPHIEYYTRINKEICEVFAERLKALKDERNLTLEDIADIIGTSQQSVVYYTMGDRLPSVPILMSIATMFATSIDYLLGLANERTNNNDMKGNLNYDTERTTGGRN